MMMTCETEAPFKQENAALLTNLQSFVQQSARAGMPPFMRSNLACGGNCSHWAQLLGQFVALQGTGDVGETVLARGLPVPLAAVARPGLYLDPQAGPQRTVYGSRVKDRRSEFVPPITGCNCPRVTFSHVLQDWDQGCASSKPSARRAARWRIFSARKQSVDSLERMNMQMARPVAAFREERPRPAAQEEGPIVVSSADGKGVVMRREPADAALGAHTSHQRRQGQSQGDGHQRGLYG